MLFNPMTDVVKELEKMNTVLIERLDLIISLLDDLIVETKANRIDFYGDGK
jgi:hypothetical protein